MPGAVQCWCGGSEVHPHRTSSPSLLRHSRSFLAGRPRRSGSEVHAAHAAHATGRVAHRGGLLRLVGNDSLGGEEQGRDGGRVLQGRAGRSEEHTSELQSLMRISYAVFCLKKKKENK